MKKTKNLKDIISGIYAAPKKPPMGCVYAGPEYFANKAKQQGPEDLGNDDTPMAAVYAGPDFFEDDRNFTDPGNVISLLYAAPVRMPVTDDEEIVEGETITCPMCSSQMPSELRFCTECGAPLHLRPSYPSNYQVEEDDEIEYTFCDNCGCKMPTTSKFCPECGSVVKKEKEVEFEDVYNGPEFM